LKPSESLLNSLSRPKLEARVAEGLPWLLLRYPETDFDWLVRESCARTLENRLGFAVTLARPTAQNTDLDSVEETLTDCKLAREDLFCRELNDVERRWLREHSSPEAKRRNLLSTLRPESVRYAG
jgi:hypothetical protein